MANRSCAENLSGQLLYMSDIMMDTSLMNITTPTSQNYWSKKMATITDFIQYEGCFNSSELQLEAYLLSPSQSSVAACFDHCSNISRIAVTTKDMVRVYCLCVGDLKLDLKRENVSSCYLPCPDDVMNTCGGVNLMSVYYREQLEAQNPREMTECVAITMDDKGISFSVDDCMKPHDGYICDLCLEKCSSEVFLEKEKLTWQQAKQACENRGGYLGRLGTEYNRTLWSGYRRWFLEENYSIFMTMCLACNYKYGVSNCAYMQCSTLQQSLCITEPIHSQTANWFDAESSCMTSGSRLLTKEELSTVEVIENVFVSQYYWMYAVGGHTPFVRNIGCADISNSSSIMSLSSVQKSVLKCLEFCKDTPYFGLTKEKTKDKCFCMEDLDKISPSFTNVSECAVACSEEKNDLCEGFERLIVFEVDKNSVAGNRHETQGVECMFLKKMQDFMDMNAGDCLLKASGYICEICESGRKNCTQEAFLGMFTWYEASDDCRNRGGNLGDMNFYDYSSLVDGVYWYGGRRWWMEQNPRKANPVGTDSCQRCRIYNGGLDCEYKPCKENLPWVCLKESTTNPSPHSEAATTEALTTMKYNTRSHRNGTIVIAPTQNTDQGRAPTKNTDKGKAKSQLEDDDMNANIIAVVVALLIICGVVVMLIVTKVRKSEKVTSDVTDLIDTRNGPTKFTVLSESTSRTSSFHHATVERQRSFSNPNFMDHDIDILAKTLDHETNQDIDSDQHHDEVQDN
ncbi:uncharacterized protein LOC125647799 isoform X2 [Ostrea edulis]|nr:uncharacterized protein LOC125647799 isoform X2 [Ostrea edulis]